jgi:hypothetical protein
MVHRRTSSLNPTRAPFYRLVTRLATRRRALPYLAYLPRSARKHDPYDHGRDRRRRFHASIVRGSLGHREPDGDIIVIPAGSRMVGPTSPIMSII